MILRTCFNFFNFLYFAGAESGLLVFFPALSFSLFLVLILRISSSSLSSPVGVRVRGCYNPHRDCYSPCRDGDSHTCEIAARTVPTKAYAEALMSHIAPVKPVQMTQYPTWKLQHPIQCLHLPHGTYNEPHSGCNRPRKG